MVKDVFAFGIRITEREGKCKEKNGKMKCKVKR
jgi:hypothetical protein